MSSVWLLPVVTLIVTSSSGGILAQAIQPLSSSRALLTTTFSVFLVSIGLSLALMILTIYFYRVILHGPPRGANVISTFVPLGPTGQAGFSMILIGENLKELLPIANSASPFMSNTNAGEIIYTVCVCIAFVLWSLATMWLVFALLSIQSVVRRMRFPFRIPFWGMIFPNVSSFPNIAHVYAQFLCVDSALYLGRLRQSDYHALSRPRCSIFPNMGCRVRGAHARGVVCCFRPHGFHGPHRRDLRGAMSRGH